MPQSFEAGRAPTERFSDRVEDYERYRPGYPQQAIDLMLRETEPGVDAAVADIGSGTGIFTRLLATAFGKVYAVEPNAAMRAAAEATYRKLPAVVSVNGTAEATGLPDNSVDLVTCAQSFHWFRAIETRREFVRILRPPRRVALIWNTRLGTGRAEIETPLPGGDDARVRAESFSAAYEELLLTRCPEYPATAHRHIDETAISMFFLRSDNPNGDRNGERDPVELVGGDQGSATEDGSTLDNSAAEIRSESAFDRCLFDYHQDLDWIALKGRVFSSSYVPREYADDRHPFTRELRMLFDRYNSAGRVRIAYRTELYLGSLASEDHR